MHGQTFLCRYKEQALLSSQHVFPFLQPTKQICRSTISTPTMLPTPPPAPATRGSNEELLVTQARLYRLLVEATDRLQQERGLPRTGAAEVARLNGLPHTSGSSSNNVPDDSERKGSA